MKKNRVREPRGHKLRSAAAAARKLVVRIAVVALTAGSIGGGWLWLTRSPSLAIREIAVEGTNAVRAEEIRALLNVKTGDNLLFADLKQARARAEGHPWVARCAVKRELPDRLVIVVEERTPRMILSLDRLYYVDDGALPFKPLAPGDDYDLPVLTGLTREDLLQRAPEAKAAIAGALELLAALATEGSALAVDQVSEISWSDARGYAVITLGGREAPYMTVRFGSGGYASKLDRLARVLAAKGNGEAKDAVRTIDLTYASRVIVAR